tara:strand:- start:1665 stop:1856 length:192 start_codon:yes stop_codon:yes gene_type:complete
MSIIYKMKTGWTVPAREWANTNVDKSLISNAYQKSQGTKGMSKESVLAWMLKDWTAKYKLESK